MRIPLEIGASTTPTTLIPFAFVVDTFDDEGVILSLDGQSKVRIGFTDWETGLTSIGTWNDEAYVVQSGDLSYTDDPADGVSVFFRSARLEQTRVVVASYDEDEEYQYDDRFGLTFITASSNSVLWTISDPFAEVEISTVNTRDDDVEQGRGEVVFHGNGKYYVVQGMGEFDEVKYKVRVSEVVFAPEDLNQRCKACEEPE